MKIWITKYALTDGIIEAEIIEQWNVRNDPVGGAAAGIAVMALVAMAKGEK